MVKWHRHRGLTPRMSFYRDRAGLEVDLVLEAGPTIHAMEIKSATTLASDFFQNLDAFAEMRPATQRVVVYGGHDRQQRTSGLALPWNQLHSIDWGGDARGQLQASRGRHTWRPNAAES